MTTPGQIATSEECGQCKGTGQVVTLKPKPPWLDVREPAEIDGIDQCEACEGTGRTARVDAHQWWCLTTSVIDHQLHTIKMAANETGVTQQVNLYQPGLRGNAGSWVIWADILPHGTEVVRND